MMEEGGGRRGEGGKTYQLTTSLDIHKKQEEHHQLEFYEAIEVFHQEYDTHECILSSIRK